MGMLPGFVKMVNVRAAKRLSEQNIKMISSTSAQYLSYSLSWALDQYSGSPRVDPKSPIKHGYKKQ